MGNIASPNIIKASDINDLSINSLTTSGDITCNGNISVPSGSVTANQYYGRKFKVTELLNLNSSQLIVGSQAMRDYMHNYEFLGILAIFSSCYFSYKLIPSNDFIRASFLITNSEHFLYLSSPTQAEYITFRASTTNSSFIKINSFNAVTYFFINGLT